MSNPSLDPDAPPPATAPAAPAEPTPQQRLELARAAGDALLRLRGPNELHAAVLALLLPAGSHRARRAWRAETDAQPGAAALREQLLHLPENARLPWLETLVSRLRDHSLDTRQALLAATRRVMAARGVVRPIDRLHWLAMRQWLGEGTAAQRHAAASEDLSRLPQGEVSAIAAYTAFLSRLVPVDVTDTPREAADAAPFDATATVVLSPAPPRSPAAASAGPAWYDAVMTPWRAHANVPPCQPPDTDGLVHALHELQAMAWMQRPMLVRRWVTAAHEHAAASASGRLENSAADALRLSCTLLDSPLPPELAQHFGGSITP